MYSSGPSSDEFKPSEKMAKVGKEFGPDLKKKMKKGRNLSENSPRGSPRGVRSVKDMIRNIEKNRLKNLGLAENLDLQLDMKRPQLEKVIGSHEAKGNITKIGQLVSTKRTYFQHKPMYMAENGGSSNLENTSLELGSLDENNVGKVKNSSFIDTKIDSNSNGDEILAKSQRKSPSRMLKIRTWLRTDTV